MNTYTVLLLCFQACLIQNVYSQCASRAAVTADPFIGPGAPYGLNPYENVGNWGAAPYGYRGGYADVGYPGAPCADLASYGGVGEGNVAVAGELPVAGNTAVTGQVPITGAVKFGGDIPAAGVVTITGKCSCGCGAPYDYLY